MINDEILRFYASHGPLSDPCEFAPLYAALPHDLDGLCAVVNGLVVHDIWIHMGKLAIPEERKPEINIRATRARLRNLLARDAQPLTTARAFAERSYGCCRDEALLLCSFLRQQGTPARVRKGFMPTGNQNLDHAICQVWSAEAGRWLTVDVQMDNMKRERERLGLEVQDYLATLTPQDSPPGSFITGGEAWLKCRREGDDPNRYCIQGDLRGWWFIRHNLLRDLLALNKLELLCWDNIPGSLISSDRSEMDEQTLAYLDHIAEMTTAADISFAEVRRLVEDDQTLQVPYEWMSE